MSKAFADVRISFDPIHIQRLMPFKAVNDIRWYLSGICVEKAEQGGVYLIASDGHTMGVIYDGDGSIEGADQIILKITPALAAAAKASSRTSFGPDKYRMIASGTRLKIATDFEFDGDAEYFVQAGNSIIDGKFPDWRAVTPDFEKLKRGLAAGSNSFNAAYMARLEKVAARNSMGVTLWQEAENKPIIAQVNGAPELLVIIMPMHGENDAQQRILFKPFAKRETAMVAKEEAVAEPA